MIVFQGERYCRFVDYESTAPPQLVVVSGYPPESHSYRFQELESTAKRVQSLNSFKDLKMQIQK